MEMARRQLPDGEVARRVRKHTGAFVIVDFQHAANPEARQQIVQRLGPGQR